MGEVDGDAATEAAEKAFTARVTNSSGGRYGSKGKRYAAKVPSTGVSAIVSAASKGRYSTASQTLSRQPSQSDESEPSSLANSLEALPPLSSRTTNVNGFASVEQDEDVLERYVEERYGRNLDLSLAPLAKIAMRRRIAGVLREAPGQAVPVERIEKSRNEDSDRGVKGLTEGDVYLYPTGMSAIWHAHQLAMGTRVKEGGVVGETICFGYVSTFCHLGAPFPMLIFGEQRAGSLTLTRLRFSRNGAPDVIFWDVVCGAIFRHFELWQKLLHPLSWPSFVNSLPIPFCDHLPWPNCVSSQMNLAS